MLSKAIIATAALAASVAAYDLPTCWTACFEKYEVDSEGCLCTDKLGDVVGSCVASGCNAANATAYTSWLASYCNEAPVSSNTWAVPSSTYVIPSSVPVTYSAPPAYSTPAESSPVTYSQGGSWSTPVESSPVQSSPASSPTTSICTESTTLIWRSSTAVVPTTITHVGGSYPSSPVNGGGWGTYPAGNGSAPATATGSLPPAYSGPVATGAAAKVGAGVAAIGGVIAAAFL